MIPSLPADPGVQTRCLQNLQNYPQAFRHKVKRLSRWAPGVQGKLGHWGSKPRDPRVLFPPFISSLEKSNTVTPVDQIPPTQQERNKVPLIYTNCRKGFPVPRHRRWPVMKTLALKWLGWLPSILCASQLPASVSEPWELREGQALSLRKLEGVDKKKLCPSWPVPDEIKPLAV